MSDTTTPTVPRPPAALDGTLPAEGPFDRVPETPELVLARPATCVGIEGRGPPGTADFHARIGALWRVATRIQAEAVVAGHGFAVTALETLWWADGGPLEETPPERWRWLHLLRVPDGTTVHDVARAREGAAGDDLSRQVRLERLDEGACVQAMHRGPYDQVGPTYARMTAFAREAGYVPAGHVHEAYLDDPAHTAPARVRTVCRVPVRPHAS